MSAYYNENDPFAAAWLRELIKQNLIAPGEVDTRSIVDVRPEDLNGFKQCHFFAGIGGWSYALRLAGWPDNWPVWTGSCPCQPFSSAGRQKGFDDSRHLWPHLFRLIGESRPHVVFGEQVASAMSWLDLVSGDLEGESYSVGAAIVGAHSVGAPHIRQRIYWVADNTIKGLGGSSRSGVQRGEFGPTGSGSLVLPALEQEGVPGCPWESRIFDGMEHSSGHGRIERGTESGERGIVGRCSDGDLGHSLNSGSQGRRVSGADRGGHGAGELSSWPSGHWDDCDWLPCIDGKARPVEPGTFPLAHGIPGRVGRLRGYGNAIVPQVAAEFINAYMDI